MTQDTIDFLSNTWTRVLSIGLLEIVNAYQQNVLYESEIATSFMTHKLNNLIKSAATTAARLEAKAAKAQTAAGGGAGQEVNAEAELQAAKEKADKQLAEQQRAQQEIADAASAVFEQTRTAAERYRAEMTKLDYLVQRGAISHETYTRAVREQQRVLAEANAEAIKGETAKREAIRQRIKEIEKDAQTPAQQLREQLQELADLVPKGLNPNIAKQRAKELQQQVAELNRMPTQVSQQFGGLQGAAAFFGAGAAQQIEKKQLTAQEKTVEELKKINSKVKVFAFS